MIGVGQLALALALAAPGQPESAPQAIAVVPLPPPPNPVEFRASVGVRVGLKAAGGKPAAFAFADPSQPDAIVYPQDESKRDLWVFVAFRPGTVRLVCSTGPSDGIAHAVASVSGPNPEPGPAPPTPPGPPDPLVAALRAAYAADQDPRKPEHLRQLIALYDEAAKLPHARNEAGGYRFNGVSAVAAALRAAGESLMPGSLREMRRLTVAELSAAFPNDAALTDASRDRLAELFRRIADSLRQVG